MQILSSEWWKASCNITKNIKKNSIGARAQPCLTPFLTAKPSYMSPLSWTRALMPSWNCCTMEINLSGHPYFASIFHNLSLLTVSKAFVRSTKIVYRLHLCSWHFSCSCLAAKIMSTVPHPTWKPHCLSGIRPFSRCVVRWLSRTLASTFQWWIGVICHSDCHIIGNFLFSCRDDDKCILEVLQYSTLLSYGLQDVNQILVQYRSTIFVDFSWYSICSRCLAIW